MITFGILIILAVTSFFPCPLLQGQTVSATSPLAFVDNVAPLSTESQGLPVLTNEAAVKPAGLPGGVPALPPSNIPAAPVTAPVSLTPLPNPVATPPLPAQPPANITIPAPLTVAPIQEPVPVVTPPITPAQPTPLEVQPNQPVAPQPSAQPQSGLAAILAPGQDLPPVQTQPAPTGEPVQTQTQTNDTEEKKDIYLNFDNAELGSFINYIAEIKKLNLIPDKGIENNKISLTIREPLSVEGAWNVFLTVLETAGFSIVQVGDVYKVVPKDKKAQQPLPAYINVPLDKIPDNDSSIRYVMFLTNLQATDLRPLAESMLGANGTVVDVKEVNSLIFTDKCYNIKATVKVLQELEQMGTVETVSVIHLKSANAADVKALLDTIIKQPEVNPIARLLGKTAEGTNEFFPPGTRIIPEERTNSLILMGNPKPIKKIEEFITNHIDTELKAAKSPLHVFELQYADATQIAEILNEVTKSGDTATGQAAAKYGAIRGGVKYFKNMLFKVDTEGNRLIVSSADTVDWKLLKQTLKDLDKPQPQVAIETLLVTVSVNDTNQLGGNIRNKKHGMIGTNIDFQSSALTTPALKSSVWTAAAGGDGNTYNNSILGDMVNQITKTQGLSVLTFGKTGDLWGIFQAIKSQTNASVLSQPFVTVANKTKATVAVGSTVRVIKEEGDSGKKGYDNATAKTTLELTPQINIDGVIKMHLNTQINEFLDEAATRTQERKLETDVTIADGQVLVLGGFVKTKVTENKYKTPFLSDLPLLGWMFKNQKRTVEKQYIFIFLRPTIIKPRQTPGMGLYTKMKLHNVTDDIENAVITKQTPDPIHNWFFNPEKENYSHKVIDFANARYQPTTVDIKNDPYYRTQTVREEKALEGKKLETPTIDNSKNVAQVSTETPVPKPTELPQAPSSTESTPQPVVKQVEAPPLEEKRTEIKNLITIPATPPAPEIQQTTVQVVPPTTATPVITPSQVIQEPIPAKREQFKELITPPILQTKNEQPAIKKESPFKSNPRKIRSLFKENLTPTSPPPPLLTQANQLNVNMNNRNRLKEFLANNQAFARKGKMQKGREIV